MMAKELVADLTLEEKAKVFEYYDNMRAACRDAKEYTAGFVQFSGSLRYKDMCKALEDLLGWRPPSTCRH